ncbi:Ig-like domain-containing protein [uncultured Shewanella sp.]|uniref:Ig-like domain-containing protein n=1 Tax=uncultured Shewanella sp. TaxID=173975 RepID=UPI00260FF73D|nr:Ig-like domain-containing protein [uncultured Shewanella sp.]
MRNIKIAKSHTSLSSYFSFNTTALLLVLILVGCGGDDSGSSTSSNTASDTTTTSASDDASSDNTSTASDDTSSSDSSTSNDSEVSDTLLSPSVFTVQQGDTISIDLDGLFESDYVISIAANEAVKGTIANVSDTSLDYTAKTLGVEVIPYTLTTDEMSYQSHLVLSVVAAGSINNAPVAHNITLETASDKAINISLVDYITDLDGDELLLSQLVPASDRFMVNGALGVSFSPNGFVGVDQAVYVVEDGHGGQSLAYIVVNSTDANPAMENMSPTAKDYSFVLDLDFNKELNIDLNQLNLIDDVDGDTLKLTEIYTINNRAVILDDVNVRYTPDTVGVDHFSYMVSDENGGYAIGTVTVVINDSRADNTAPTAKYVRVDMFDNSPVQTFSIENYVDDIDGDALYLVSLSSGSGRASLNRDDPLTINYDANGFIGTESLIYTVTDNNGGYQMATFEVTVLDSNPHAPVTLIAELNTTSGTDLTVNLADYIADVDSLQADLVISKVSGVTSPAQVSLSGQQLIYSSNAFKGVDVVSYQVSDGRHVSTGYVVITVNSDTTVVTANNVELETLAETPITVDMNDFITVTDPTISVDIIGIVGAQLGQVKIVGNTVTYMPYEGVYGTETLVYSVKNSRDAAYFHEGLIEISIIPPASPVITALDFERTLAGELIASVGCESCVEQAYEYQWTVNDVVQADAKVFKPEFNGAKQTVRLTVSGKDKFGQTALAQHVIYDIDNYVVDIVSHPDGTAFAALMSDKTVRTWGDPAKGGDSSAVADELINVKAIYATSGAFAAVTEDKKVVAWGEAWSGGDPYAFAPGFYNGIDGILGELTDVEHIYSTVGAFLAQKSDGSLVAWGVNTYGGDPQNIIAEVGQDAAVIVASQSEFVVATDDGRVYLWGIFSPRQLSNRILDIDNIYTTEQYGFAVVKMDGTVETLRGGLNRTEEVKLLKDIDRVFSNKYMFAGITYDGAVEYWGADFIVERYFNPVADRLTQGVEVIVGTGEAFAALKNNGEVVVWGVPSFGGDASAVQDELNDIANVYANDSAFVAVKQDPTEPVIAWGNDNFGADVSAISASLTHVKHVYTTPNAFAALKTSGEVMCWGNINKGGDCTQVSDELVHIDRIYSNGYAFAAVRDDGKIILWGDVNAGGDNANLNAALAPSFVFVSSSFENDADAIVTPIPPVRPNL